MSILGIDVSNNNGTIDWHKVPADVRFAYLKATEGVSFVDSHYHANVVGCVASGRHFGAYHFLDRSTDPAAQARHFAATVGNVTGQLPPVLDIETANTGESWGSTRRRAEAFLAEVDTLLGRPCGIYASEWFYGSMGASIGAGRFVWIAKYSTNPPAAAHNVWQYDAQGTIAGIGSGVDLDRFDGTDADLAAWAGGKRALTAHEKHLIHLNTAGLPMSDHEIHELHELHLAGLA